MKLIALALALLVAVNAQNSMKCVTPPRWTGSFREIDFDSGRARFANISYDASLEAISILEVEREPDTGRDHIEKNLEVFLFQEKKSYYVDLMTKTCEEKVLNDEFRPFGVSDEDQFSSVNYIGGMASGIGVRVNEYYRPDRSRGDFTGSYAPYGIECIPVLESYVHSAHGPVPSRSTNTHIEFMNIELVNSFPPDTFLKPSEC